MEKSNLKYMKRNWCKDSLKLHSTKTIFYGNDKSFLQVIMYAKERKIAFNCYHPELKELFGKALANEKVKVWFIAESNEYNQKWYTKLVLKWAEIPRLEEAKKIAEQQHVSISGIPPNENFE